MRKPAGDSPAGTIILDRPKADPIIARPVLREAAPAPVQLAADPVEAAPRAPIAATFAELGVAADLCAVLAAEGIEAPFEIQSAAIPAALEGRDLCGKARTGSGKTLAFGIPLVQRVTRANPGRPRALVLVPTRELANQVAAALNPLAKARKLRGDVIFGGVSLVRQSQAIRSGIEIAVATPGRLNDLLERGDVNLSEVETVVIDEADQMADMGFLPQVQRIMRRMPHGPQVMLFSATLDGDVDLLIQRYQQDPLFVDVTEDDTGSIETMEHRFIGVTFGNKLQVAAEICSGPGRYLIFVRTQRNADRLVTDLERLKLRPAVLHGGLRQGQRERALAGFAKGTTPLLVATNLAARGIHVDAIDVVMHYDPPEEYKAYLHRSGRTARAGADGLVVTLVMPSDELHAASLRRQAGLKQMITPMEPGDERLRDLAAWQPDDDPVLAKPIRRTTPHFRRSPGAFRRR